jgi:hypothetical protein
MSKTGFVPATSALICALSCLDFNALQSDRPLRRKESKKSESVSGQEYRYYLFSLDFRALLCAFNIRPSRYCSDFLPRPLLGRIEGESEPPNLATEKSAGYCAFDAPIPPSPVRVRESPTAKTPRNRVNFSICIEMDAESLCNPRLNGGESGIRTHGTFQYTRFPSVRLKPLGHLSG